MTATPSPRFESNNFDLIRLFAASQVMIIHGLHHLGLADVAEIGPARVFNFLPGVPIFFFVSGFLISASYQRSRSIRSYAVKRVRRIFPALWLCLAVSIVLVLASGYDIFAQATPSGFLVWLAAQGSFVQFYNPDFLRGFGVGALNGSLWTISVELQFYVLMPVLAFLLVRSQRLFLAALAVLFAIHTAAVLYGRPLYGDTLLLKLLFASFIPWIWMFMLGYLAQVHWARLEPLLAGHAVLFGCVYAAMIVIGILVEDSTGLRISGNNITLLWFLPMAAFILSLAYTKRDTAHRLLGGNDISYGLYIYHMPIFNFWLHSGWDRTTPALLLCIAVIVVLASASWFLVERVVLRAHRVVPLQNKA